MGGKQSSGGSRTPYIAPNTGSSAQSLKVVHAICEGEIQGFVTKDPLQSVYFDNTPVQSRSGEFNFHGVTGLFTTGAADQTYLPGFEQVDNVTNVGVEVKKSLNITRTVSNDNLTSLRVTVGVSKNSKTDKKTGDVKPTTTQVVVDLVKNTVFSSQVVTFTEKSSGNFMTDVVFDKVPASPFNIRVSRITDDSNSDLVVNNTYFFSYVEIIGTKLNHANTALAAWSIDTDQFGSSMPTITYDILGKLIQVPSNYDPVNGTYNSPVWDGSFKVAWSNNPMWVLYDILTTSRYSSIASRIQASDIDKWTLYAIGKWCDDLVDDGFGGKERRAVCNVYASEERTAYDLISDLCSIVTGYQIWNGAQFSVVVDKNDPPVAQYTNTNVENGQFTYSGVGVKAIHTAVYVQYIDRNNNSEPTQELVQDDEAVRKYGFIAKNVTAFGCDSRGQAIRFAKWLLETERRQQLSVSFTVGREGLRHLPHDIIQVADSDYAGTPLGGRVTSVKGNKIRVPSLRLEEVPSKPKT